MGDLPGDRPWSCGGILVQALGWMADRRAGGGGCRSFRAACGPGYRLGMETAFVADGGGVGEGAAHADLYPGVAPIVTGREMDGTVGGAAKGRGGDVFYGLQPYL